MALTNKSRTAIYSGLTDIIDEDAVEEMLTNFPARDIDEPVTRDFLSAQLVMRENRCCRERHSQEEALWQQNRLVLM
jgi:hypothetical protein